MAKGDLLGHIDCPSCKTKNGMRVTEDKNGHPFGYCEAKCSQQMRVGGDARRVEDFFVAHPHLKRQGTVTHTDKKPDQSPVTEPEQQPAAPAKKSGALEYFGL